MAWNRSAAGWVRVDGVRIQKTTDGWRAFLPKGRLHLGFPPWPIREVIALVDVEWPLSEDYQERK